MHSLGSLHAMHLHYGMMLHLATAAGYAARLSHRLVAVCGPMRADVRAHSDCSPESPLPIFDDNYRRYIDYKLQE